jgi:hypothetical protein
MKEDPFAAKPDLVKLDQGGRLVKFRVANKFKTRTAFANLIGTSTSTIDAIEDYRRKISKSVFALIDSKFPNYDREWLEFGTHKKLLTENIKASEQEIIFEERVLFDQKCQNCSAKDKIIEGQRIELEELRKKYIECLEQVSGVKKAASG